MPPSPDADLLLRFQTAIDARQRGELEQQSRFGGSDDVERRLRTRLNELVAARSEQLESAQSEFETVRSHLEGEFESRLRETDQIHQSILKRIDSDADAARSQVQQQRGDSEWVVTSVLDDTAEDSPVRDYERVKLLLTKSQEDQAAELMSISEAIDAVANDLSRERPTGFEFETPTGNRDQIQEQFLECTQAARKNLRQLNSLWVPKLLRGWRWLGLVLVLTALVAIPVAMFADPALAGFKDQMEPGWLGTAGVAGVIAATFCTLILYTLASMKQSDLLRQASVALAEGGWLHQHWLRLAKEDLHTKRQSTEEQQRRIEKDRSGALRRYEQAHERKLDEIDAQRTARLKEEHSRFAAEHGSLHNQRREQLAAIEQEHVRRMGELDTATSQPIQQAEETLQRHQSTSQRTRQEHWFKLKADWETAARNLLAGVTAANEDIVREHPEWGDLTGGNWQPANEPPRQLRLGRYQIDLNAWEGAISSDMRLAPRTSQVQLPLAPKFPRAASLLFLSPNAEARQQALRGMQSVMLRLLATLPPGKLRFTIIDPVGLGESFAGFMHLADYDEMLVTSRIWTEAGQIEARLADLTEHMENVLQKYLRNEFPTIEEYNASAGEVAEPYHFLVIGDFPAKFSEIAARRLVSIVNSGPRCGVYTLLNLDPTRQLPNSFQLADIEPVMTKFFWRQDAFHSTDDPLAKWPIELSAPPPPEQFTSLVRQVGEASKDARLVQVSFDRITPTPAEIWSRDSRSELVIPLGRAGATKLQQLRLGKGTSQHMLVAGKTGSGKSTFLHILITNLSLFYSPDEVNFFLIDFKKGVEFKDYATQRLPHARVIAVESDREFGVSALQKLDDILQERGELFRRHGVQDIAGYREATQRPLPRILLVVDEFQEFFVEDDKLSQTASLLLDRLVRQGRAFGMHVILGSQTLGGAYSLARTTLGQVAVRVALQCSDADAHLILSEENTAARLLARPGEAIYNDANGLVEGNHPFQIAWISDRQREQALSQIQQRAVRRGLDWEAPVVFEGNIPSDLTRNTGLERLIAEFHVRQQPVPRPTLWLGDSVEIGPPAAIMLQRQSGQNLLLVGQDPEAAQGVLAAALLALGSSGTPQESAPRVILMDGSHADSPEAELWKRLISSIPAPVSLVQPVQTAAQVQSLHAELVRREEAGAADQSPPMVLMVFNLARFRDLRKPEEEFSMSSFGGEPKPPEPGKLFAELVSRGPAVGIHVLAWCDSFNNLDRWLSRASLKEMELRIAFQMNASDSSNFIDTPAAARLGTHRALLYREETGTAAKFRPYGIPSEVWLSTLSQRMLHGPEAELPANLEEFSIL